MNTPNHHLVMATEIGKDVHVKITVSISPDHPLNVKQIERYVKEKMDKLVEDVNLKYQGRAEAKVENFLSEYY